MLTNPLLPVLAMLDPEQEWPEKLDLDGIRSMTEPVSSLASRIADLVVEAAPGAQLSAQEISDRVSRWTADGVGQARSLVEMVSAMVEQPEAGVLVVSVAMCLAWRNARFAVASGRPDSEDAPQRDEELFGRCRMIARLVAELEACTSRGVPLTMRQARDLLAETMPPGWTPDGTPVALPGGDDGGLAWMTYSRVGEDGRAQTLLLSGSEAVVKTISVTVAAAEPGAPAPARRLNYGSLFTMLIEGHMDAGRPR